MASAYSGTGNSNKLKNTLSELESALADWDKIPVPSEDATNSEMGSDSKSAKRGTPPSPEIPDEMKRRTKELLDRLKQQIDEL